MSNQKKELAVKAAFKALLSGCGPEAAAGHCEALAAGADPSCGWLNRYTVIRLARYADMSAGIESASKFVVPAEIRKGKMTILHKPKPKAKAEVRVEVPAAIVPADETVGERARRLLAEMLAKMA